MAIRDGISIELDDERARQKALEAAPRGKRRRKAATAQEAPRPRKASVVVAVLAIAFIFVVASAYAFFNLRGTPPEPKIEISPDKTSYSACETITMTIRLTNPQDGVLRSYELGTTQKFQLEVYNESGSVVASYDPQVSQVKTKVAVGPGQSETLGTFKWNQTMEVTAGANTTYVPVPAGMYTFKAWLNEHPDIWAKRNLVLG
jgi:hypothetical protein